MEIKIEDIRIKNKILCDIILDDSEKSVHKIYNYFKCNYNLNDFEFNKLRKYISISFMSLFKQKFKCFLQ